MRNKNAKVSDPNTFISNPGDEYHVIYTPDVQRDGTIILIPSGKEKISDIINSQKEQTDINYIMKKLTEGDLSVLEKGQGTYGDFTNLPKNPAEWHQQMIDAERMFNTLPIEERNKFNNSYMEWLNEGHEGSEKFFASFGVHPIVEEEEKVEDA